MEGHKDGYTTSNNSISRPGRLLLSPWPTKMLIFTLWFNRRFLRYTFGQDHFHYGVLPFSLSPAPSVFLKVLSVVAAHLHKSGNMMYLYLDDYLLKAWSFDDTLVATQKTIDVFTQWGLQLNTQKLTLTPGHHLEFIGAYLDAVKAKAFLPLHRFNTLTVLIDTIQTNSQISARNCLQLLGHMVAGTLVISHMTLHMHCLQA